MAVTSGFFDSLAGDRKYNTKQMAAILDGLVNDGVYASIGTAFSVTASSGNTVNVGIGRAWFNHVWVYNDAILPVTFEDSELVLDRIDALVIEVNDTQEVRDGMIKVLKGTPASQPVRPTLTNNEFVHQYPLVFIRRKAGSTSITQADITNMIGTSSCPYVTGIVQVQSIDNIVAQWSAQWAEWFAFETGKTEEEANSYIAAWAEWYLAQTTAKETEINQWITETTSEFTNWFNGLQDILDGDAAAKIAADLLAIQEKLDILEKEKTIYSPLLDSNGEEILGSDGTAIIGRVVFSGDRQDIAFEVFEQDVYTRFDQLNSELRSAVVVLKAADWIGDAAPYTQTVSFDWMSPSWIPGTPILIPPSDATNQDIIDLVEAFGFLTMVESKQGELLFTCAEDKPMLSMTIRIPGVK